jgi:demethylmenaquinone methyltransferase/2-methoxy-6-polyprenyl-1,4-benzoquinol methylase
MFDTAIVRQKYSKIAGIYDLTMPFFKLLGLTTDAWRKKAVRALDLRPGSTVLDLACGTGLNFPFLQEAVGPTGKIIGVDLTPEMLAEAQKRIERHGWNNVELIAADVTQDELWQEPALSLPKGVDGILSTFAMQVIPDHDTVIEKCAQALHSGGRLVILDATSTSGVLRFLNPLAELAMKSFAVSYVGFRRKPWEEMRQHLADVQVTETRFFNYLASGTKEGGTYGN